MNKVLSCSIEVFTSAESECVVLNIPCNPVDPRLGYESKCFLSLDEFVSYVRQLPDVDTKSKKVDLNIPLGR